jgi:Arc/MetJ family transcription regulator
MELQALRYAAMVSAMTFDQAAATLARHRNKAAPDLAAARAAILTHLEWTAPNEEAFAQETRIILAAADFGKEITTTVIWLRDRFGVDISCVRLRPHRMDNGSLLLDIQPLIPLPEAAEFQTQIGAKQAAERKERAERHELRYRFWASLLDTARPQTNIHATRSPSDDSWVWGGIGRTGFGLNYVIRQRDGRVELKIDGNVANGATAFAALKAEREAIEAAFGGALDWEEPPTIGGWRICHRIEGGYRDAETDWPAIQDRMIKAMIRLDAAVRARVAKLP